MECFHHCGKFYWTAPGDKTLNLLVERLGKQHVSSLHSTKKLLLLLVWINSLNKHLNSFHLQTIGENWFECQNSLTGNSPLTIKFESTVLAQSFVSPCDSSIQADDIQSKLKPLRLPACKSHVLIWETIFFFLPSFSFLFHDSFLVSEVKHLC